MKIVLEVIDGPHRGRTFAFEGHDCFLVGRGSFAHFQLPGKDPYFSRAHFLVEVNPPLCRLVDLGSTNGTRVNGSRVAAADLHHGDLIQAGNTVLKVSLVGALESTESYHAPRAECSPALPTRSRREAPPAIEGYRLLDELGRGGMGRVYLAERCSDGGQVALKTIRPALSGSEREIQRFLREAEILRQLQHPNIVAFYDMGVAGDLLYFVMEHVRGADAARLLERQGPFEVPRVVRLVCQVLEALQYAHALGFVHRDVKPANLLVRGGPEREECKLADFGLARVYHDSPLSGLTLMGEIGGTLPFMPPEQITDYRHANPASDQYATAATLYRLLTGSYLFDFDRVPESQRLTQILLEPPVPITSRRKDVPAGLARAIHRAVEKEPAARFPDISALRDAIRPFAADA